MRLAIVHPVIYQSEGQARFTAILSSEIRKLGHEVDILIYKAFENALVEFSNSLTDVPIYCIRKLKPSKISNFKILMNQLSSHLDRRLSKEIYLRNSLNNYDVIVVMSDEGLKIKSMFLSRFLFFISLFRNDK